MQKGKIDFVCGHVRVVTSKKGFMLFAITLYVRILCGGYRFILFCISIVSGLESRGLIKLFIVDTKGLLKLILHFFLTRWHGSRSEYAARSDLVAAFDRQ